MTDLSAVSKAPSPRRGWFDSLKEQSISFFKGDNNAPWAILAETAIGCIPILGQIVDARDIIKGLVEVSDQPDSTAAWFNVITALIGLIPGGGDATKRSLRAIKSGAANVDDLLAMIRRFYSGDPEKLLRQVMDLAPLRNRLDEILNNPRLLNQLSPQMHTQVNAIRGGLDRQFAAFKKEVDGWLAQGRKTSAEAPLRNKQAVGTPDTKPNSWHGEGRSTRRDASNEVLPNRANAHTQRTARFKQVNQKLLGVLGEHMADYYCQDVKGWGKEQAAHDNSEKNPAKLNDQHRMVQLWPCIPRGRGIDAVWKPDGPKPYAIIEAKASFNPAKSLGQLLGAAGDKIESNLNGGGNVRRRTGSGGNTGGGSGQVRQVNGKVTQMSNAWIESRLQSAVLSKNLSEKIISHGYSRHILFFSVPQAVAHSEALLRYSVGASVISIVHATHEATREWRDNEIQRVANNRAGLTAPARNRTGR
ncbi:hypothetical protein HX776_22885 [Pseudomonas agarici]|uniref:hypothetical protein n=1 Tax=Pseudomonas agarici TaxID=46677 RepID=UPI00031433F6|nr:hypothetical protein [Pseudomonas agarici]NWC11639.1 hypothetical protein [Pseudomonas agarici]SEL79883.1 hypothetical protein SAMN05216604_13442 [Pseudomonas agarici]